MSLRNYSKNVQENSLRILDFLYQGNIELCVGDVKLSFLQATVYQGLKQVVPWKSRKSKQDGIVI